MGTGPVLSAGQRALPFLLIVPGARAAALGEAFTGVARGPEAVSFNPAGLAGETRKQISLQHTFFIDGILYDNLIYLHPHTSGTWAAQAGFLSVKGLKKTVADPTVADGFAERGDISTNDMMAAAFYSRNLTPRVSAGAGAKFARESLHDATVTAAAFDLGILYRDGNLPLDVGVSVQNLGATDTPRTLRAGFSVRKSKTPSFSWVPEDSMAAVDVSRPLYDGDPVAGAGIEIPFSGKRVTARAGYRYPLAGQHLGHAMSVPGGFALGFGLDFSGWNADYSASSFGELGLAHRLSFSIGIGS